MPVYSKQLLSGSVDGVAIAITATSAAGANPIHTVQAAATTTIESLWLWLGSRSVGGANVVLQVQSATATNSFQIFLPELDQLAPVHSNSLVPVFQGLPLTATSTIISAWNATATGGPTWAVGYFNRIATG